MSKYVFWRWEFKQLDKSNEKKGRACKEATQNKCNERGLLDDLLNNMEKAEDEISIHIGGAKWKAKYHNRSLSSKVFINIEIIVSFLVDLHMHVISFEFDSLVDCIIAVQNSAWKQLVRDIKQLEIIWNNICVTGALQLGSLGSKKDSVRKSYFSERKLLCACFHCNYWKCILVF